MDERERGGEFTAGAARQAAERKVLVLGGTGRTGRRVLEQLLGRGVAVRAIVRSGRKIPAEVLENPGLEVVEADLLALRDEDVRRHLRDCEAVISCLGHVVSIGGIFGPPRDLVTRATARVCRELETLRPGAPVRFILMSSVSVHCPGNPDSRRGAFERAFLWALRGLLPPARDNQNAADFLRERIGADNPFVRWAVVRPDSLLEGGVSKYALHEGLVNSLLAPGSTDRANVAHFMCELATNPDAWAAWAGKLPVIVNARPSNARTPRPA